MLKSTGKYDKCNYIFSLLFRKKIRAKKLYAPPILAFQIFFDRYSLLFILLFITFHDLEIKLVASKCNFNYIIIEIIKILLLFSTSLHLFAGTIFRKSKTTRLGKICQFEILTVRRTSSYKHLQRTRVILQSMQEF